MIEKWVTARVGEGWLVCSVELNAREKRRFGATFYISGGFYGTRTKHDVLPLAWGKCVGSLLCGRIVSK
jgi:hypothetical protein